MPKDIALDKLLDGSFISEEFVIFSRSGDLLLKSADTDTLIKRNQLLINMIFERTDFLSDDYETVILPLIRRFIDEVNVAPASAFFHDNDAGGLVRHSLLTCVYLMECSENSSDAFPLHFSRRQKELVLLICALLHDTGKLITDYKVSSIDKDVYFNPEDQNSSLRDFIENSRLKYLRFSFNKRRGGSHDGQWKSFFYKLCLWDQRLGSIISPDELFQAVESVLDLNGANFKLLKRADAIAAAASLKKYHDEFSCALFLKSLLYTGNIDTSTKGFYKTSYGFVVEASSDAFNLIVNSFDRYQRMCSFNLDKDNFDETDFYDLIDEQKITQKERSKSHLECDRKSIFVSLNSSGFFTQVCYKSRYSWFLLRKGDETILVYGLLVEIFDKKQDDCFKILSTDARERLGSLINMAQSYDKDNYCIKIINNNVVFEKNTPQKTYEIDDINDKNTKIFTNECEDDCILP